MATTSLALPCWITVPMMLAPVKMIIPSIPKYKNLEPDGTFHNNESRQADQIRCIRKYHIQS